MKDLPNVSEAGINFLPQVGINDESRFSPHAVHISYSFASPFTPCFTVRLSIMSAYTWRLYLAWASETCCLFSSTCILKPLRTFSHIKWIHHYVRRRITKYNVFRKFDNSNNYNVNITYRSYSNFIIINGVYTKLQILSILPRPLWVIYIHGYRGVTLTTHPHLVRRSRMTRSYISSPPKRLHGRVVGQLQVNTRGYIALTWSKCSTTHANRHCLNLQHPDVLNLASWTVLRVRMKLNFAKLSVDWE
jgi:hypothetical protein